MASFKDDRGTCLVARAAPSFESTLTDGGKQKINADMIDPLSESLKGLQLGECAKKLTLVTEAKQGDQTPKRRDIGISPADFIALQSMRSSALAGKTNTTSRFSRDQRNLIADLLLDHTSAATKTSTPDEEHKKGGEAEGATKVADEPKNKESALDSAEKRDDESPNELISRGPLRTRHAPVAVFHPYGHTELHPSMGIGAAMQSHVRDPTSYTQHFNDYGYECGVQQDYPIWAEDGGGRILLSSSSTPDTAVGNYSATNITADVNYSRNVVSEGVVVVGSGRVSSSLERNKAAVRAADTDCELPEALSDFILEYSRTYAAPISPTLPPSASSTPPSTCNGARAVSRSDSSSGGSDGEASPQMRRQLADRNSKQLNSPLAAGSAPMTSPAAPLSSGAEPQQPSSQHYYYQQGMCGVGTPPPRQAKDRLRAMVSDEAMDEAALWTCKCVRHYPGALRFQDQDRDSLLHIVAQHMDLAKICALVEQMIKMDLPAGEEKPFDMRNNLNETPLFLAVMKDHVQVINYLLEAGAEPNVQSLRFGGDTPLHYAAARGMSAVTQTLCSYTDTDTNKTNAKGFTPLMCAVLNNGLFDEAKGAVLDNTAVVKLLLQYGGDPTAVNSSERGKSTLHYAVERMDAEIVELLRDNITEQQFAVLLSKQDADGRTPLDVLQNTRVPTSDPNEPGLRARIRAVLLSGGTNDEEENVKDEQQ